MPLNSDNDKGRTLSGQTFKPRNNALRGQRWSCSSLAASDRDSLSGLQSKKKALQAKLKRAQKLLAEYRARSDENVQEYLTLLTSYQNPKEHPEEMRQFGVSNLQLSENIRKLISKIGEYEQQLRQVNAQQTAAAAATNSGEPPRTTTTTSPKQETKAHAAGGFVGSKPAVGIDCQSVSSQFYAFPTAAAADDQSSEATTDTKSCSLAEHDNKILHDVYDMLVSIERSQDKHALALSELRGIVSKLTEDVHDLIDLYQIEMSHLRSELRRMEDKLSYTTHEQHGWLEDKFSSMFDKLALIETYACRASSKSGAGLVGYVGSFTAFRHSKQSDQTPEYEEDVGIFYNCVIAPVLNLILSILAIVIGLTSTAARVADMLLASKYFRPFILPLTIVLITFFYYFVYCRPRYDKPGTRI